MLLNCIIIDTLELSRIDNRICIFANAHNGVNCFLEYIYRTVILLSAVLNLAIGNEKPAVPRGFY